MTVCVAALCGEEEDPRVVVAADHLVTSGGFMEFEHPGSKIVELGDQALVMVAGNTIDGMRLVNEAAAGMDGDPVSIPELAQNLGQRYAAARLHRAEQTLLVSRGLSLETFYNMHNQLNQQVVMLLDNALGEFGLGVELSTPTATPAAAIPTMARSGGQRSEQARCTFYSRWLALHTRPTRAMDRRSSGYTRRSAAPRSPQESATRPTWP
jgi:hypothetical protein